MCNTNLIKAERAMALRQYNKVITYFKMYMNQEPLMPLNEKELNMLTDAFKNILDNKRYIMGKPKAYFESFEINDEEYRMHVSLTLNKLRNDVIAVCTDAINIINGNLIFNYRNTRESVIIYMMKGDYYM